MAGAMKLRAQRGEGFTEVKGLLFHPMENGLRADEDGNLYRAPPPVEPHYIETLTVTCAGREVLRADWASAVSRNPYFAFRFQGGEVGDRVAVVWTDSAGQSGLGQTRIA